MWTGDNDSEVIDFLDRWHLGDAWRGDGYLYLPHADGYAYLGQRRGSYATLAAWRPPHPRT